MTMKGTEEGDAEEHTLDFTDEQTDDESRRVIVFPALYGRQRINCMISYETIKDRFGTDDPMDSFTENRQIIEDVARARGSVEQEAGTPSKNFKEPS